MPTDTIEQPAAGPAADAPADPAAGVIRIDAAATYTVDALARALQVSERQLREWRKKKKAGRPWMPRPLMMGRTPCWRGSVILQWLDAQQAAAMGQ